MVVTERAQIHCEGTNIFEWTVWTVNQMLLNRNKEKKIEMPIW